MSSNLDSRNSSVRDIAKLFPEDKRLGTKASDLVSGTALTKCLDVHEAFEVLGTPAEQRVAILASTVVCADTPHGAVVKQAISGFIRKHKETVPTTPRVFYSKLLLHRSVNRHSMYRLKFREWEIHI